MHMWDTALLNNRINTQKQSFAAGGRAGDPAERRQRLSLLAAAASLVAVGCVSVPGETLAPYGTKREVSNRLLAEAARARPTCRQARIVDTEVLELHGNGKVASERWTAEQCGERVHYRVTYPAKGNTSAVLVKAE